MSNTVLVRNRQHARRVDARQLRNLAHALVGGLLRREVVELDIQLVAAPEMTRCNEKFLRRRGSTDVLAFDYSEAAEAGVLHGEILICVDEAGSQARRFHTTWQKELVRYLVHGVLHLCGYDDHRGACRRRMKQEENRLLRALAAQFDFRRLERGAF